MEIKPKDAFAQILITDTGMGIAQEDWDQIFEPFFRGDKSRSRAMGGAGLALVREITCQYGGDAAILQSSPPGHPNRAAPSAPISKGLRHSK